MKFGARGVLYYPHVPRALDQYLRAVFPTKYNDQSYRIQVSVGDTLRQGEVIATYGYNKITAPCDGEIVFLGGLPGRLDWPDRRQEDLSVSCSEDPITYEANNINRGAIVFPETVDVGSSYAFAICPNDFNISKYYGVRRAFDEGNVWHDGKKPTFLENLFGRNGDTVYTTIDLLVCALKYPGSGTKLPEYLLQDKDYRTRLFRYWDLINSAVAAKEIFPNQTLRGPF